MPSFEERLSDPSLPPAVSTTRFPTQPVSNDYTAIASAAGDLGRIGAAAIGAFDVGQDKKLTKEITTKLLSISKAQDQGTLSPAQATLQRRVSQRKFLSGNPKRGGTVLAAFEAIAGNPIGRQAKRAEEVQDAHVAQTAKMGMLGRQILGEGKTEEEYVQQGREFTTEQATRANEIARVELAMKKRGISVLQQAELGIQAADSPLTGANSVMHGLIGIAQQAKELGAPAEKQFQETLGASINQVSLQYRDAVTSSSWFRKMLPEAQASVLTHVEGRTKQWQKIFDVKQGALGIEHTANAFKHFINVGKMNGGRAMDLLMVLKEQFGERMFQSVFNQAALDRINTTGQLSDLVGTALDTAASGATLEKKSHLVNIRTIMETALDPSKLPKSAAEAKGLLNSAMSASVAIESDPGNSLSDKDLLGWANQRGVMGNLLHQYVNDPESLNRGVSSYGGGFHRRLKDLKVLDPVIADNVADGASITAYKAAWASALEAGEGSLHYDPDTKQVTAAPFVPPKTDASTVAGDFSLRAAQRNHVKVQKRAAEINRSMALALRVAEYDPTFSKIPKEQQSDAFIQVVMGKVGGVSVVPGKVMTKFAGETTDNVVSKAARTSQALNIKFQNSMNTKQAALEAQGHAFAETLRPKVPVGPVDPESGIEIDPRGISTATTAEDEFGRSGLKGVPRPGAVEGPIPLDKAKTTPVKKKKRKVSRSFIPRKE